MQGNIVSAARWVFAGMVLSTALLVGGIFFTIHAERLCPWLFQGPPCVPDALAAPTPSL